MGRRPRIHYDGAVYHVMARGVNGQDIFSDDADRIRFKEHLLALARESGAYILAYCLMGNHFHIAMQVGTVALASIMHRLLTGYSKEFNRRHDREGHLFQARYKAIVCRDEKYLAGLIRYIHLNPVRAGFVARAQDWPWSSLAGNPLFEDASADIDQFDPWPREAARNFALVRRIPIVLSDLESLGEQISARTGIHITELRSNASRRSVVSARRLLTQEAIRMGHPLAAIARWMNASSASLTRYARSKSEICGKPGTI